MPMYRAKRNLDYVVIKPNPKTEKPAVRRGVLKKGETVSVTLDAESVCFHVGAYRIRDTRDFLDTNFELIRGP